MKTSSRATRRQFLELFTEKEQPPRTGSERLQHISRKNKKCDAFQNRRLENSFGRPVGGFNKKLIKMLGNLGHVGEFVKEQYRHCKPILVLGAGQDLVENAGVPLTLSTGERDPGVLQFPDGNVEEALAKFIEAIAKHRHFDREMDPPRV